MPGREPPYFAVVCGGEELDRHLAVCADSDFHVIRDPTLGLVRVHDRGTILLEAVAAAGGWLVRLHGAYYRHPLQPGGGDAMPGVP